MMDFGQSMPGLEAEQPPAGFPPLRRALWWDAKGDWHRAHDIVAADEGPAAARIHAYLHRKEGDLGNAHYWYARAGLVPFVGSLEDEWRNLAETIEN